MWRNIKKTFDEVLPLIRSSQKLIVFDTETTGLGKDAKIIQFSAIRYNIEQNFDLTEDARMDIYINPEETISTKITEITGITNDMVKKARTECEEVSRIANFLSTGDLLAAYNCSFDERMLRQMSERTGYYFQIPQCIDVLKIARDLIDVNNIDNHKLESVINYLFPEKYFQYHSSIEDVVATAEVLKYFIQQGYIDDMSGKTQAYLEWASYTENPRKKSEKRIKLKLSLGEYGDIFWDVVKNAWGCKSTAKAKKLFSSIDLRNLEQQLLNKYGWRYHVSDIESLAKEWGKAKRKQAQS